MKHAFIWAFSTEEHARACVALLAKGNNIDVEQCEIKYDDDDDTFDLWIETDSDEASRWFSGFACAFARMTPGESDVG